MTLLELVTELREYLSDAVAPYQWGDALLTGYLSAAREEYCLRRPILDGDTFTASFAANGDGVAELDPVVLAVARLSVAGVPIPRRDPPALDRLRPGWETETGETVWGYLVDEGRPARLRIWPMPTVAVTAALQVQRLPLESLDWSDNGADIEELPVTRMEAVALVWWAAYLAFQRRDEDTHDPKLAERARAAFDQAVGPRPDARALAFRAWASDRRPRVRTFSA